MSGQIGTHTFDWMFGTVPEQKMGVEVITKPGEDGHVRRKTGIQQPVFQVRTLGVYTSKLLGQEALRVFLSLVEDDPVAFVKDGLNYTTAVYGTLGQNYQVAVLDVQANDLSWKSCVAGFAGGRWLLDATWTLILVPI